MRRGRAMPASDEAIDKLVLLLVAGKPRSVLEVAAARFGIEPEDIEDAVAQARTRLTRAAEYDRDEQFGIAVSRMNDIYSRAITDGDIKTALTAQREISKLLDLPGRVSPDLSHRGESDGQTGGDELESIADHLLPLGLAPESYPLREHARIAADIVRQATGGDDAEA